MTTPVTGVLYHGRLADIASTPEGGGSVRLSIYVGPHLHVLAAAPELARLFSVPPDASALTVGALAEGALVAFQVDGEGRVCDVQVEGGPLPGRWSGQGDAMRWRRPVGADLPTRMEYLQRRSALLRELRAWLHEQGFLEVETPTLVAAPSPEPVFEPIAVYASGSGSGPGACTADWLITSPEYQLKRMLVGGFERIYRLGPVYRGGEVGAQHNPEFAMLEWYRVGEDAAVLGRDLEGMLGRLAPLAAGYAESTENPDAAGRLAYRAEALRHRPYPQATVRALFRQHLGMELGGVGTGAALAEAARAANLPEAAGLPPDFTGAFSELWLRVEAQLPPGPLLVTEWPAPTASLARLKPGDPTVAERVELYVDGVEIANGFAELTDAVEQRRRFEGDLAARAAQGLPPVPLDEAFLSALAEGMPPAAGMALGFDRLVMLLTGAPTLGAVLPFAWSER